MSGISVDVPLETRHCENCACYFEVRNPANPLQSQGFCRREPPQAKEVRVALPMMNGKGEPMMGRDGKPRMEERIQLAFVHELTARQMTCFDGWRPLGTVPGADWRQEWLGVKVEKFLAARFKVGGNYELDTQELLTYLREWRAGPPIVPPAANDSSAEPARAP